MTEPDSIWFYFTQLNNFAKCKEKECKWNQQLHKTKSTSNLIRHLENNHKELHGQMMKAREKKNQIKEKAISSIPKITNFTSNVPSSQNAECSEHFGVKRSRNSSGEMQQPTIVDSFTQWKEDGHKAAKSFFLQK